MKHMTSFWPGKLTNAAHGQYVTSAIAIFGGVTTENEKFKADLAALKAAFAEEDTNYVIAMKSEHTATMEQADAEQDNGVNGMKAMITAAKYDPAKAAAAQKVEDVIRPYRLDTREQMAQEAYKVLQCATALEEAAMKPHVEAIGATQFVEQMKQGATALQEAMRQRNDERAGLTPDALSNARFKTDEALKEALYTADAMLTLFGVDSLPQFAAKMNELIRYTKQHMMTAPAKPAAPAPDGGTGAPAPSPTPDPAPEVTPGGDGHSAGGVVTPVKPQ